MDDDQKQQIVQQIVEQAKSYIITLQKYIGVMNILFSSDDEKLIHTLISVNGNSDYHWRSQIENTKDSIFLCPSLIKKLEETVSLFQNIEYTNSLASQYLQLVSSEISSSNSINNLSSWLSIVSQNIESIYSDTVDYNIKRNTIQNIIHIMNHSNGFALRFIQSLAQLDTFEHFSTIEHSVVIIGANGSGKSSFSRTTRKVLGGNVVIISAQKIFAYQAITSIPLGEKALQDVYNFQRNDKLGRDFGNQNEYGQDLFNLILSLISEHNKQANDYYSGSKDGTIKRKASLLEQTMQVWGEIIVHRFMRYEEPNIKINTHNGGTYDFSHLSDGEKAIFYYISHILIAKENSFIIIDEPENHLHMGVVSRLWDKLESLRTDCKFIYLTHNLDFAASRTQATKLWNKSFTPPAKWDVEPLPTNQDLPEPLLMEVLGSRKKILFCEGDKSSLDYKLYTLLFPCYTVKPVGGHIEVINYTKAFNKSHELFGNTAIGIIDGDFHLKAAISKWETDSIFCIHAQEVENVLCDEVLLEAGKDQFLCPAGDEVEKAKENIFIELENKKENQAIEYATQKINNILKSNLIEKTKTKEELEDQFRHSIENIDINALIEERIAVFDKILHDRDYDLGIRSFNNKGLVAIVGNKIVGDYKNRVFRLLDTNQNLLQKLREKYFSNIPLPESGTSNN